MDRKRGPAPGAIGEWLNASCAPPGKRCPSLTGPLEFVRTHQRGAGVMDVRIQTLGGLRVSLDGREKARLSEQPTRAALLVYLAVERDAASDAVQGVLWSRLPPDRARHALNQAVYLLRTDLGEGWVAREGERLRVSKDVSVDVRDFEERVRSGALDAAMEDYRGGFLDGWHLRDTPEFEQWTDGVRTRLARLHREACRTRLRELRDSGEPGRALEVARAWVERDPLEDEAHHALIELLWEAGRRGEALEHFGVLQRLLEAEGLTPLDETRALVAQIRSSAPTDRSGATGEPEPGPVTGAATGPSGFERAGGGGGEPRRRRGGPEQFVYAAGAAVLAGLALYAFTAGPWRYPPADPNRVLVYPLENRTGAPGLDATGRVAADWITQGLARAEFLTVVPSAGLLPAPPAGVGEPVPPHLEQARSAARNTRSGLLVTGGYYVGESGLVFQVQVLEAPGFEVLETVQAVRTRGADPIEAVDHLRQRVTAAVALHRDDRLAGVFGESEVPPSYEAYVAFVEGLQKLLRGDWFGGARDLTRAHEISPGFTAPLIPAAAALAEGPRDFDRADSLLRIVEASRDRLPIYDRLRLDLVRASLEGDHGAGLTAAREAARIVPGGTAHFAAGLQALKVNHPGEALEILSTFDPMREVARAWTLYWDVVTQSHHILGDHRSELREARRGRRIAPHRLEALWYEVRALGAMGRTDEIHDLLELAGTMTGSPALYPGGVMVEAAEELHAHGFHEAVPAILARFRAWHDALDADRRRRAEIRSLRGRALSLEGRLEEAREVFLELNREAPDDPEPIRFLGTIAARLGDPHEARERSRALGAMDPRFRFGRHTLGRAAIAARLGEPDRAVALLQRAVAQGLPFGTAIHADPDLETLRGAGVYVEFMRPRG